MAAFAAVVVVLAAATFALVRLQDGSGPSKVTVAATASAKVGTFRVAGQFRSLAPGNPPQPEDAGSTEGVVDLAHNASDITSGLAVGGNSARIEQISVGSESWTSLGESSFPTVPPKTWVRVPYRGPAPDRPGYLGFNPVTLLEQLKASSTIRLVGHEIVRGTQTDHYQVEPRLSKSDSRRFSDPRQDVWVGSDHLLRRVKSTVDLNDGSSKRTNEIIIEFYDFGVPVDIHPPPADQVLELPAPPLPTLPSTVAR